MSDTTPQSIDTFDQVSAKLFYKEKLQSFMPSLFGALKSEVIDLLEIPHTAREIAELTNKSYQTINDIINEFKDKGLLVSTEFQAKRGRAHQMNYSNLLVAIATTQAGQTILLHAGVTIPSTVKWEVNRDRMYSEVPMPKGPVLELKLGRENTNLFKVHVAAQTLNGGRLFKLFYVANMALSHIWYRNYLMTEGKKKEDDSPILDPGGREVRACVRNLAKQIREYAKLLESIADNELVWGDSPTFESFRVLGDLPLQWQKSSSATFVDAWQRGAINAGGWVGQLQEDYEATKTSFDYTLKKQWEEHMQSLSNNSE